jgi:hypothetical protein
MTSFSVRHSARPSRSLNVPSFVYFDSLPLTSLSQAAFEEHHPEALRAFKQRVQTLFDRTVRAALQGGQSESEAVAEATQRVGHTWGARRRHADQGRLDAWVRHLDRREAQWVGLLRKRAGALR